MREFIARSDSDEAISWDCFAPLDFARGRSLAMTGAYMPNMKAVKSRITSAEQIKKIAGALEIVALTRLQRMQQDTVASRDYFEKIRGLLFDTAGSINFQSHPLLEQRKAEKAIGVVAIFSDKGLCGGFNASVNNEFLRLASRYKDKNKKIEVIGLKGGRYFKHRKDCEILNTHASSSEQTAKEGPTEIGRNLIERFLKGDIDEILLVYSRFRLHLLGEMKVIKLLPLVIENNTQPKTTKQGQASHSRDYIYEPGAYEIFDNLIREYIINQIHQGILESRCAEEMSRMLAMKAATDNANDMIAKLNIEYHKGRQAQITREITEIVSAC